MLLLKTKRLLIRKIEPSDIQTLVEIWSDPAVTQFMGGPCDQAELKKIFAEDVAAAQPEPYDLHGRSVLKVGRYF